MNQLSKVSVVKVGAFSYTRYPELDPVIKLIDEQSKDYYANPLLDPEHTLISEIVEVHLEHVPQESQNQLRLLKLRICREKAVETYARDIADRDKEMEKLERGKRLAPTLTLAD